MSTEDKSFEAPDFYNPEDWKLVSDDVLNSKELTTFILRRSAEGETVFTHMGYVIPTWEGDHPVIWMHSSRLDRDLSKGIKYQVLCPCAVDMDTHEVDAGMLSCEAVSLALLHRANIIREEMRLREIDEYSSLERRAKKGDKLQDVIGEIILKHAEFDRARPREWRSANHVSGLHSLDELTALLRIDPDVVDYSVQQLVKQEKMTPVGNAIYRLVA